MPVETGLPDAVVAALRRGNKIEAIKRLREQTGVGLMEAKDAVDASGVEPDKQASPGEISAGGGVLRWLILLAIVALVAYYFFR